ncbi:uncharacterized protein LOC112268697 [Brachypodium distachyon]|uniref:KIB1-4 beta-propeller domain-containing protein n=1 Tax=Brachypodium distachyon TaxID=15368 RepID=A0A0Q3EV41_BRADI|nr:uncharacterized protein LOC112268697 [Brachypodium distachyon]KQJ91366.1 hypothetical protein BRADI_4g37194v3 [Brachypodium distachyon]|eukprot:XP_024310421.1 uncharacterized protein LOC112268697 [Brachypodium distachyon]
MSTAPWSELPYDLLGMLRLRIASPRDRVRFAAVCKPWRAAALLLPAPPAAPLLLLSPRGRSGMKHLCGPNDSWVLRVPKKALYKQFLGSHDGGWVAAVNYDGLMIVNLFSGAEVVLSADQTTKLASICSPKPLPFHCVGHSIWKIVFSGDPASSDGCTLAVLMGDQAHVAVCRVGCPNGEWAVQAWHGESIQDIAFCNGDLYGLTLGSESLIKFEISMKLQEQEDGGMAPVLTTMAHKLAIQRRDVPTWEHDFRAYFAYIFELHGEPAMAVRTRWPANREPIFRVFKLSAAADGVSEHRWAEVTSLGDYALFLGVAWSKAVHLPMDAGRCVAREGLERNHIYYSTPTRSEEDKLPGDQVYSVTSEDGHRMYCRKDQSVGDSVGRTGYHMMGWHYSAMWLLPPDF